VFRYFKNSPEVIRVAVMLYVRYPLSLRQVGDLLFERGIEVSHETVRYWWNRFGPIFAAAIRKKRMNSPACHANGRWHVDEFFVKIGGDTRYLWREVHHEGAILDAVVTKRHHRKAALKLMRKLMKRDGRPVSIVADRLRSYGSAFRELERGQKQELGRWLNNRAENSHQPFRGREPAMHRYRRDETRRKFVAARSQLQNHFNGERHLVSRQTYKEFRTIAFAEWRSLAA